MLAARHPGEGDSRVRNSDSLISAAFSCVPVSVRLPACTRGDAGLPHGQRRRNVPFRGARAPGCMATTRVRPMPAVICSMDGTG